MLLKYNLLLVITLITCQLNIFFNHMNANKRFSTIDRELVFAVWIGQLIVFVAVSKTRPQNIVHISGETTGIIISKK